MAPLSGWKPAVLAIAVLIVWTPTTESLAPAATLLPERTLAFTFDDLPYSLDSLPLKEIVESNRKILEVLQRESIASIGFVNEAKLEVVGQRRARTAVLESWLDAGQQLGNHTYSHVSLQTTPLALYQQDVLRGERVTRRLLAARGLRPRYFRHPYTRTGPTLEVRSAFETFLSLHGYRVAPFTIENSDFIFSRLYREALRTGSEGEADRISQAYLQHTLAAAGFFESMSEDLFGRPIAQILLIHANRINADLLGTLVRRLRQRGYGFASLEAALQDPAYDSIDLYAGEQGLSWLHRWEVSQGRELRVGSEPRLPDFILEAWRELQDDRRGRSSY